MVKDTIKLLGKLFKDNSFICQRPRFHTFILRSSYINFIYLFLLKSLEICRKKTIYLLTIFPGNKMFIVYMFINALILISHHSTFYFKPFGIEDTYQKNAMLLINENRIFRS